MNHEPSLSQIQKEWHGTANAYLIGFTASLLLTSLSFLLVAKEILSGHILAYTLIGLGILQAAIQLRFFLHLGQEARPRWETLIFYFMLLLLMIVAFGTLWIMSDLNDRMMMKMDMK